MNSSFSGFAELLHEWQKGSREAESELFAQTYCRLRRLARECLRAERPDHTLQPTELVHEAYVRLARQRNKEWQDEGHFGAVARQAMRQILIQHARDRNAKKRSGRSLRVGLDEIPPESHADLDLLIDLERCLAGLETDYPRQYRMLDLFFFGGMPIEEIARDFGVSVGTVERELRLARAWLLRAMRQGRAK